MNELKIIIAGLGTVGSSVLKILETNRNNIENRINKKINICGITAKNKEKKRIISINDYTWFDDPIDMINKTQPDLFIELMGYQKGISYDSIKLSLEKKINVITANKSLIAHYGNELISIADNSNLAFLFEAAVAGAIPIINTLKSILVANKVIKISGILNGTTNYILSNMLKHQVTFLDAFNEAKEKGYVEANPNLDIEGIDSAHKLSILSSLAFGCKLTKFDNIHREGISKIDIKDINYADKLNLVIKLIGSVEISKGKLIQYVKPIMVSKNYQLAKVNDVLNGIEIKSQKIGNIFLEGAGAGGPATASSIISDISEFSLKKNLPTLGIKFNFLKTIENFKIDDHYGSFFIRFSVIDKKGVLAEITSLFKVNNISIGTMIQNPNNYKEKNNILPLIIITHETYLKNINNFVDQIISLNQVKDKPFVMQIYKV